VNNNSYEFDDIFKTCGYTRKGKTTGQKTAHFQREYQYSEFQFNCNDIPFGFQGMYPQLFVIIGEIIGNAVAGRIPLNVQDAFGNWLQLIGQVILTYNAQQQYFQGGPGRYFNPIYYNVTNPFCQYEEFENNKMKKHHKKLKVTQNDISKLDNNINELVKEINSLKYELNNINERINKQ